MNLRVHQGNKHSSAPNECFLYMPPKDALSLYATIDIHLPLWSGLVLPPYGGLLLLPPRGGLSSSTTGKRSFLTCHSEVGFHLPLGTLATSYHPKVDLCHPEVGFLPLGSGLSIATGDFSFFIPPEGRSLPPGGGLSATLKWAFICHWGL